MFIVTFTHCINEITVRTYLTIYTTSMKSQKQHITLQSSVAKALVFKNGSVFKQHVRNTAIQNYKNMH